MFCLQHRRAAGHDPAGERGRGQRADIDAAGAAVGVGAQHAEHQHLRHKQDQQRHERAAERRAEQQICARRDVHKERDVFDQHDDQNAADHHERVAPPAAEEALEARLICGFAAGGGHDLAVVQDKEQRKDRKIDAELSEPGCVKGLEERPDEPEVQQKCLLAEKQQHVQIRQHAQDQQRAAAEQAPAHAPRRGSCAEPHALPAVLRAALFVFLIADDGCDQHDQDQKQIPAEEAVADRHAEDIFRQRQEAVAELRHERIRRSSEQHRDDCAAPPRAVRLDGGLAGQRLHRPGEERRCEQQLHHSHERCDCREHGDQYGRLLRHGDLICRRERQIKADGIGEPCQRRGETMRVVGREPVVGVQQLHAAGGAVFEASIGRVPRGLVCGAAEELRAAEIRGDRPRRPGAHRVAADRKTRGIDIVHGRQQRVGTAAARGAVCHGIAVGVGRVLLVEKAEVVKVHHDLVAGLAADGLERAVLDAVLAVVDRDLVIDVAAVDQSGRRRAVAVFVQTQDHRAAAGQLDGVGRAGLMVVLVAVQQQNVGGRGLGRGGLRRVQLVHEITDVGFNLSFRNGDGPVSALDAVSGEHAAEDDRKQQNQRKRRFFPGMFHHIAPL